MPKTQNRAVMNWLFIFGFLVAFIILWGGFTRLTRSGLSITEWNPISGTVPPLSQQAWEQEFAKYQQTPEFVLVNSRMTLPQYKLIFFIEWFHRLLARSIGLVYALPVFYFLFTKRIPWREFGIYSAMGMLFIAQAFAGWFMVASGLVDRPSVSHILLTVHLFLALSLLGLSQWTAFGHRRGFPTPAPLSPLTWMGVAAFAVLLVQLLYGGFTAGLKAGFVSNEWPLMNGYLIPPDLFSSAASLVETPHTIMFIHRWWAWLGLLAVPLVHREAKRRGLAGGLVNGLAWLTGLAALQIGLGILTVTSRVNLLVALLHQANAIGLFVMGVFFLHQLRLRDGEVGISLRGEQSATIHPRSEAEGKQSQ